MARITVTIQGSPKDKGRVRLTEFIKQLEAVKTSLRHTERLLTQNEESTLYYQIVELTYSSPARVVIEPVTTNGNKTLGARTVKQYVTNLRQVTRGKRPARADLPALRAYQNLTSMLKQNVGKVAIKDSGNPVVIDNKFATKINKIIGPDELAEGSMFGMLEWLNLHRNINRFHIYPTVGPYKVDCEFRAQLKPQVIAAVDRYVQVSGQLRYKRLESFPYAINVADIEVLPPENELPTIYDLRGIAPEATGDVSASDFVRALRDET